MSDEAFEYIVVGAGAGGGVLAARLAEAGKQVLLLEAGGEGRAARSGAGEGASSPARNLGDDYAVPAFHSFASEHPDISWDFWVHHYDDPEREQRDPKFDLQHKGVLYPRCSTLGGCTAHNAMIIVRPDNADWNHIAVTMDDDSWLASNMNRYFRRMERCRHRSLFHRLAAWLGWNPSGHGWSGWLSTEKALPLRAILDWRVNRTIRRSIEQAFETLPHAFERWRWLAISQADPNDSRLLDERAYGVRYAPMSTHKHRRVGPRELLHKVSKRARGRLIIRTDALVTRVEIDPGSHRARAVFYRQGERLYRASADTGSAATEQRVEASAEIILCGGTFNTPQLLMLSGIGDRQALQDQGIDAIEDLPGVGGNLQDRYEVSVINRMKAPWAVMRGARFQRWDRLYRQWRWLRRGVYTSNGVMLSVTMPSSSQRVDPDLFCFALLGRFPGYSPGYSEDIKKLNYLSWMVLKARTRNRAGRVSLRSADPTEPPDIRFRYFDEGDDADGEDLEAVLTGLKFARAASDASRELIDEEELPGRHLLDDEQLRSYIRDHAWGHHACGTCAMKPREQGGVVDSDFKVYGIDGLRVVDASVFPRIPGFFIVSSVYMIAEKAADVILGRR